MINRQLRAFGLAPSMAYPLIFILFIGLSFYIFYKTTYAIYIYPALALSLLGNLSHRPRNDFLQQCFPQKVYHRLRMLENGLLVLPFVLFLFYKMAFLVALVLGCIAALLSWVRTRSLNNFRLPTPFYRYPFEFTRGFRKAFLFFGLVYFIAFMGIWVGNFNLTLFALVLNFTICFSFYSEPEAPFYVWIFAQKPTVFLVNKIKTGSLYANLLALPICISAFVFFSESWWIILLFQFLACLFLITIILAKYADFPRHISLPSAIFLSSSLLFPPLLLILIPFFYKKALQQLNLILA